jgi:uncharacterized repeat protein (TIGR01451 family)
MATAVAVSDAIPAGLTIVSVQPSQGTCTTAGAINCSLGTMVNGGSAQILVTATVAAGASAGATIDNSATVSGFQADPNPANNASSATITIVPVPPTPPPAVDLQVVKHVSRQVAAVGQPLTYTIDVKNNGPGTVPDAIVTDTSVLPLDATSIKPSQGTCAPGVPFTCHLGTLAAGKTATITVTAHATKTGSETNWVTDSVGCRSAASCPPGGPPRDTNLSNNISHAKTTLKPAARLVLVKTASRRVVAAGQNITFHLKVSDPTSVAIYQVTVCDTLPSRLGYESSNPKAHRHRGARCWMIGKLGAHRSKRFTVVANASPGRARKLVNHATASAPGVTTAHASAPVRVSGSSVVPCVLASQARVHTRRHRHGPKARIAC